jgi:hypothetical protein
MSADSEPLPNGLPLTNSPTPHRGYDPNQPRVPAGHDDGGQWTRTPGGGATATPRREVVVDRNQQEAWGSYVNAYRPDGSLAEQRVFNRDGSRIVSEFNEPGGPGEWEERHTVTLAGGRKVTFQSSGDVQRIYDGEGRLIGAAAWTEDGPQSLPVGQLAFVGPAAAPLLAEVGPATWAAITAAGLALFAWLSARKERDRTAVFAFKASKYEKSGPKAQAGVRWVGYVKRDDLKNVCNKLGKVQELTDEAVAQVRKDADYKGPADFGTKVHKKIADAINGLDKDDFKAEQSALKSRAADAHYGERDSVRMDAYEDHREISTVCVYDPKTGWRGLSFPRMTELAMAARKLFRYDPRHIIVVEVRPAQGQP